MIKRHSHGFLAAAAYVVSATLSATPSLRAAGAPPIEADPDVIARPEAATPTLGLDGLRRGMRGYGMTVFAGVEPEPFAFEVVAVVRDSTPGRSVIWVECVDPRLVQSGPVQGMSGSPMYVWRDGETETVGEGGALIGAFAFGYAFSKTCYVGVQPIEYMRELATRGGPGGGAARPAPGDPRAARGLLTRLRGEAAGQPLLIEQLQLGERLLSGSTVGDAEVAAEPVAVDRLTAPHAGREVEAMRLPVTLGTPEAVRFAAPLLAPHGLRPIVGGGGRAGERAYLADGGAASSARLAPGTTLAVPLVLGDWDAAAAGTVTDVLPDGTVLGFGHPMFGFGDAAAPMATGEVHFVMPKHDISFKQSSSLRLAGTLRRDAAAGVAGGPGVDFETAEVNVSVRLPGLDERSYAYRVVEMPGMTATFAAISVLQSVTAVQGMPLDNTARLRATLTFAGDETLELDTLAPRAQPGTLAVAVLAPTALMTANTFEPTRLVSADVRVEVETTVRQATLADATLRSVEVAPGETAEVTVVLQPFGEPAERRTIAVEVPHDAPEGDYVLAVGDAQTYLGLTLGTRPHLFQPETLAEQRETIERLFSVKADALYAVLQLQRQAIAVGRSELPGLPSSRAAILATPTSTRTTRYVETVHAAEPTPYVTTGSRFLTLSVRQPRGRAKPADAP